jgi:hypothetical protein
VTPQCLRCPPGCQGRPTKDSDENAKNVATHDVSMSDTTSFNSDATEDGSTSLNDLAVSKDQSGDVDAGSLYADTIYSDLTVGVKSLADARSIDNEKQSELQKLSDANRSVRRPFQCGQDNENCVFTHILLYYMRVHKLLIESIFKSQRGQRIRRQIYCNISFWKFEYVPM